MKTLNQISKEGDREFDKFACKTRDGKQIIDIDKYDETLAHIHSREKAIVKGIIEKVLQTNEKREDGMGTISKVRYATPQEIKDDILSYLNEFVKE